MNARIEPTVTLEEVAKHIEQWRSGKNKGERIPEQLWSEALGLLSTYGISRVSRTLRLSYTELNKRRGSIEAGQHRQDADGETGFVEIDRSLVDQALRPDATAVWMELERPDGLRLRIRPTRGVDMLALVERFMGARPCCS
jgi:hypothetical protein